MIFVNPDLLRGIVYTWWGLRVVVSSGRRSHHPTHTNDASGTRCRYSVGRVGIHLRRIVEVHRTTCLVCYCPGWRRLLLVRWHNVWDLLSSWHKGRSSARRTNWSAERRILCIWRWIENGTWLVGSRIIWLGLLKAIWLKWYGVDSALRDL